MALPTEVTVTGTLLDIDGNPAKGHVVFQSPVSALDSGSDSVVIPSYKSATLAVDGTFSITIPASDDPLWTPVGWRYTVIVRADDAKYSFRTVIPYDAPGGEILFSELVPALDGGSELYAAYSHTHAGEGGGGVTWNEITGKPTTFPPSAHTHDDRYFTEAEVTTLLADKEDTGVAASLIAAIDFPVDSVAGRTGAVVLVKADVGLSNVDNTSDANKPVSTATATALSGKSDTGHAHAISDVTNLQTTLDGKAATSHTHTIANVTGLQTALDGKQASGSYATTSETAALDGRLDTLEAETAPILSWNGSAYVEDTDAKIYVGPSDPGSVPDGSVWIEVV